MSRLLRSFTFLMLAVGVLHISAATGSAEKTAIPVSVESDHFASLVDIGDGRRIYLECRGMGSPTVVLEAGYRSSARVWNEDLHQLFSEVSPACMRLYGRAGTDSVCSINMSSGRATTTGPGRPELARWNARLMISGVRRPSSICVDHLVRGENIAR
jgi:hypothetical protein